MFIRLTLGHKNTFRRYTQLGEIQSKLLMDGFNLSRTIPQKKDCCDAWAKRTPATATTIWRWRDGGSCGLTIPFTSRVSKISEPPIAQSGIYHIAGHL